MSPDKPAHIRQAEVKALTEARVDYVHIIRVVLIHHYATPDLFVTLAREVARIAKIISRALGRPRDDDSIR
jgi:hypothetical protein